MLAGGRKQRRRIGKVDASNEEEEGGGRENGQRFNLSQWSPAKKIEPTFEPKCWARFLRH